MKKTKIRAMREKTARLKNKVRRVKNELKRKVKKTVSPKTLTEATRVGLTDLPDASLTRVTGFLEVLHDYDDAADTKRLAGELDLELDDILPVIEAAELLDLVSVRGERLALTKTGKRVIHSQLDERQKIFRKQILSTELFKRIDALLQARKKMPRKTLLKLFKKDLSSEDAEQTLKTMISWGRYASFIDYDTDSDRVYLVE